MVWCGSRLVLDRERCFLNYLEQMSKFSSLQLSHVSKANIAIFLSKQCICCQLSKNLINPKAFHKRFTLVSDHIFI